MENVILTTLISGIISITTIVITQIFIKWHDISVKKTEEINNIYSSYINPLKFYIIEEHYRLNEILKIISSSNKKRCELLLLINNFEELKEKENIWFNEEGCYLTSSCYLTACLFAYINQVYTKIAYFKLPRGSDPKMLNLVQKISIMFSFDLGIYYVNQLSIGNDMITENGQIISYREFCEMIREEKKNDWFSGLFRYYKDIGNGDRIKHLHKILEYLQDLSMFLDKISRDKNTLLKRYEINKIPKIN